MEGGRQESPAPRVEAGWGTSGAGPPSFRNVSGMFPVGVGSRAGSGPSPHPGQRAGAPGPGQHVLGRVGAGRRAGGRRGRERAPRGGRGPGPGRARGGPGGRPPRAGSPPGAQVKHSSREVPRLSLQGRGSHRRAARGERRAQGGREGAAGGRGGVPLCLGLGWGWGGRAGAPPSIFPPCAPSARLVGLEWSWLEGIELPAGEPLRR